MEQQVIYLGREKLRSPVITAAAALYALAAVLGVPGCILIFDSDYAMFLLQDMIASGISDASSLQSWRMINTAVTALACIGPGIMTAGLLLTLRGKSLRGMKILSTAAQWLLYGVNASGFVTLLILIYRVVRFILSAVTRSNAVMLIYSMIISESLMVAQAALLFVLIRKFLNCCIDSTTSITYTLATGKLDTHSIPGFAATGFLILAAFGLAIAANRLFTVTIVWNSVQSYYKLLTATHPGLLAESACLICGAVANILMFRYLRRYKRTCEQALFEARKRRKER